MKRKVCTLVEVTISYAPFFNYTGSMVITITQAKKLLNLRSPESLYGFFKKRSTKLIENPMATWGDPNGEIVKKKEFKDVLSIEICFYRRKNRHEGMRHTIEYYRGRKDGRKKL